MKISFVILILLLLILSKWIIFLLVMFPVRRYFVNMRKKDGLKKDNYQNAGGKITNNKATVTANIKSSIRRFIQGYIRYSLFQVSMIPSHTIRDFLYKNIYLVRMEQNSIIYFGAEIRAPYKLKIGKGSIIGDKAVLDARRGGIVIGDNVNIGSFVKLWTGQHDYNDPYFRSMPHKRGPIIICDRAYIGADVTILHSVTIGEGAVVASGAVVTKNIEPYTLVGGVPAKKIGERNRDLKYVFSGKYLPFY